MRTRKEILLHISRHHYSDEDWKRIVQTPMYEMGGLLSVDFPTETADKFFAWMAGRDIDADRIGEVAKVDKYLAKHKFTDEDWKIVRSLLYSKFPHTSFERHEGRSMASADDFKIWLRGYKRTKTEVANYIMSHTFDDIDWEFVKKFCKREYGEVLVHYNIAGRPAANLLDLADFVGKKVL